jgi:hypothetical protein
MKRVKILMLSQPHHKTLMLFVDGSVDVVVGNAMRL